MPDQAGTLERLALALAGSLQVLGFKLSDDAALATFAQLGVGFPEQVLTEPNITPARATLVDAANALGPAREALRGAITGGDSASIVAAGAALLAGTGAVLGAAGGLAQQLQVHGPSLPGVDAAQINELVANFPRRLLDLVLVEHLDASSPGFAATFTTTGLVQREQHPGDPADPARPEFEKVTVRFDRLTALLGRPGPHFKAMYGWGDGSFDGAGLLKVLSEVLILLGLPALTEPGPPAKLRSLLFEITAAPSGLDVTTPAGASAQLTETQPFLRPGWSVSVTLDWEPGGGAAVRIRPPFQITVVPSGTFRGTARAGLTATPPEPIVVLGQAGGTRLEIARFSLGGGLRLTADAATGAITGGPVADGEVAGGRLVIDASKGDAFVGAVLGGARLESEFGVGFTFTPEDGLRFHGSAGLEIQVPVHVQIGPVEVQAVYLLAGLSGDSVPIELSAGFSARLGPVSASVDRLGVTAHLSFPAGGGNVGPADLAFAFKPPNGVGLSVNAGVVTGGGYLYADPARGEYAGGLELEFAGFLAVKAIGLITTRMPDGSRGFSLLLILTAEFGGGGLQLGYGFTLLAVGGLIGLNRTMRLDALMQGVRTGAIESVMFPQDVIANAPRILSDLRAFFPPAPDRFLIGPMAKLGWGTPTLVSVSVGVIIEIPGNIAIVGVLKVALPADDLPILVLQVNFAGAIEFDRRRLYFFAALFDSHVLSITIEGELGLLVAWGADANVVLTVGGFHPAFRPPPLPFPNPRRVSVDIVNQPAARIRASGYFAVTSNTVQFGAAADLYFGFSAFSVQGHIGFDALFQFSPFAFIIHISASVALKAFGVGVFSISLDFQLEGPTPWRAHGRGSIGFLFFEISADFDITWGEERDTTLPPIDVLPLLAAELAKIEGWQTHTPGVTPLVTLRRLPENEADLVLHPMGSLSVRQRALPLALKLDKVGQQRPRDADRFTVSVASAGLAKVADAAEMFAMAQFQDLDDAAKLSRPAFEPQPGGLQLAVDGTALASARAVRRSARYETTTIDSIPLRRRFVAYFGSLFRHFLAGNSVSRSSLSQAQRSLKESSTEGYKVVGDSYAVASARDNTLATSVTAADTDELVFASAARAHDRLADLLAADPTLAGALHVIPLAEVSS